MNVAIIKKDRTRPMTEENNTTAILQLSVLDDPISITEYGSKYNRLVFDVTDKCEAIMKYVRFLRSASRDLDIHIDILEWLLKPCYKSPNIKDTFPELEYYPNRKEITGYYKSKPYVIKLTDEILARLMGRLDNLRRECAGKLYNIGCYEDEDVTLDVMWFLKEHDYEISKAIYDQYTYVETSDMLNYTLLATISEEMYNIEFIKQDNVETNMIHIKSRHGLAVAYVGGLTYEKIIDVMQHGRNSTDEILVNDSNFKSYIREVLRIVKSDLRCVDKFYLEVTNAMKSYIDNSETNGSQEQEKCEMKTTTVDRVRTEGLIEDPETGEVMDSTRVKAAPNLTKLKWLLLYIMDTDLGGSVAHGLPVYLYKDKKHGISAIFNYWQGLNSTEEKYPGTYIEFVERYAKYNMIVVTDLMEIAKSVNLDAYAEYIGGGEPYVWIIVNRNVYLDD